MPTLEIEIPAGLDAEGLASLLIQKLREYESGLVTRIVSEVAANRPEPVESQPLIAEVSLTDELPPFPDLSPYFEALQAAIPELPADRTDEVIAAVQALSEALTVNVEVAAPEIEIDAQSLAEAMPTPEPVNLGPLVELLRSVNMNLQTIAQKEPPPPREIPPAFRVEEQADGAFIVEPVVH